MMMIMTTMTTMTIKTTKTIEMHKWEETDGCYSGGMKIGSNDSKSIENTTEAVVVEFERSFRGCEECFSWRRCEG